MVLDNTPESVLQNTSLSTVEYELSQCATQLALLGEIDSARELGSILLTAGPVRGRRVFNPQLDFAWKETGQWPEGIPENEKTEQALSELGNVYEGNWGVGVQDESLRTFDEKGLKACLQEDDQYADASTGWSAMAKSQRLVKALDISLRLHPIDGKQNSDDVVHPTDKTKGSDGKGTEAGEEIDRLKVSSLDKQSADILNRIVARWGANQQITYLAEAHPLWPLFLRGLVADAMDISQDELKAKGGKLVEAFSERLKNPPGSSPLSSMTTKGLLELADNNTVKGAGTAHYSEMGDEPPETLLRDPASKEDISDLEQRLDITLPQDYKAFLSISNGLGCNDDGIYNGYFPDPSLHAASDVHWVEDDYIELPVELLEIPREIEALIPAEKHKSRLQWDTPLPLFDLVLELGTADIDSIWLVHPRLVAQARGAYMKMHEVANGEQRKVLERAIQAFAGSMDAFEKLEWCCVKSSSGGAATMIWYSGFRKYLESVTAESQNSVDIG